MRFVLVLVAGLAILTAAAFRIVSSTTRRWADNDVRLRAQLAVNGSERALIGHWRQGEWGQLQAVLDDVTRDERIMGVAACHTDGALIASSRDFPSRVACQDFAAGTRRTQTLPGGLVQVSSHAIVDEMTVLGYVVLVHDMSFSERRDSQLRMFLLLAFAILAACASVVTVVAARLSWRGFLGELRKMARGEGDRPEFRPLLRDVRDLVERMADEKDVELPGTGWTPQRLKQTLARHLRGERIVIAANREPYIHDRAADGTVRVLHPASGLVTALEPVMRACSGVWVAHGSGSADRETADSRGHVRVPPGEDSYLLRRVWLSRAEEQGYYYGFANEGLWPLCHIAHARPTFRADDFKHYQTVNARFADAICEEVDREDAIIMIQDYHFALVPRLVRERLPRATIITFWHVPWPNSERLGICPSNREILEGLLGSSIVGFHTQLHCNNFLESVDRYLEARIDKERSAVVLQGRDTLVRPYPISVDWPNRWAQATPPAAECRASVLAELGLPPDSLLGVGVDRLDYTKGIEERLMAVERMLDRMPSFKGRFTFVQLAAPSRTAIERYQQLNDRVTELAARINGRFAHGAWKPIVLLRTHHEPLDVFRYYRAADVCYVSSLHDGMNLVAKEFVAARDDQRGVLVLSSFTGAARELTEALVVNPYDLEEASDALAAALRMPVAEQEDRMRSMRAYLAEFNVYRWAGRMIVDAARLRRRERLSGRLSDRQDEALVG
jgi:trehalose 6-phosphate synthase